MTCVKITCSLTGKALKTLTVGLLGVIILLFKICHCSTQALHNKDLFLECNTKNKLWGSAVKIEMPGPYGRQRAEEVMALLVLFFWDNQNR